MEAKSFCKGGKGSTKFKARNIGGIVVKFGIVYDISLFHGLSSIMQWVTGFLA